MKLGCMYCLHLVFLSKLNESLKSFQEGWNNHKISTDKNLISNQLFLKGFILAFGTDSESESETGSESESENESIEPTNQDIVSVP